MLMKHRYAGRLWFAIVMFAIVVAACNAPSTTQATEPPAEASKTIDLDFEVWEMAGHELDDCDTSDEWRKFGPNGGNFLRWAVLHSILFSPPSEKLKQSPPTRFSSKVALGEATDLGINKMLSEATASLQVVVTPALVGRDEITLDYDMVRRTKQGEVKRSATQRVKFGTLLKQVIIPEHANDEVNPEKTWIVFVFPRQKNADGTGAVVQVDDRQETNRFGSFISRPGRFEMHISEGWSGNLMANYMGASIMTLSGTTNVGKSKDARASDNYVPLEAFQAESPVLEVVYADDGIIGMVARRPGVASMRYQVPGLDGYPAICELQIVVAADTTEFDRTVKEIVPQASIKVTNVKCAALLTGFVAKRDDLSLVIEIAKQFYPKVINRVKVASDLIPATDPKEQRSSVPKCCLPAGPIPDNLLAPLSELTRIMAASVDEDEDAGRVRNGGIVSEQPRIVVDAESQPNHNRRRTNDELKALRNDVRSLRDDVRRLRELLEKRTEIGKTSIPATGNIKADYSAPVWHDPARAQIQAALQKSVSLDFQATPLHDVIRQISEMINVNYVVDATSLEDEDRSVTDLVTITIEDISARAALKLILDPLDFTFLEDDEVLKIVSYRGAKGVLTAVKVSVEDLSKTDDPSLVVRIYAVADLVVPLPGGASKMTVADTQDWLKLIDRVMNGVEPDNWVANGGPCSIEAFDRTYSLVIRATTTMHDSIADLLNEIRRDQDVQVSVGISFLSITNDSMLEESGLKFEFDPRTGLARIDEREAKKLIAAVGAGQREGEVLYAPKVTMFSGQIANVASDVRSHDDMQARFQLHVRANVAEDRRSVRLNVALNPESLINDLVSNSHSLDDGGYLLLDMTDRLSSPRRFPNPNGGNDLTLNENGQVSPVPATKPKARTLVLIQPRIIVPEEEEQMQFLGVPTK